MAGLLQGKWYEHLSKVFIKYMYKHQLARCNGSTLLYGVETSSVCQLYSINYWYTLKNKRVNQDLKGPRSDSVFIVLHLPFYPAAWS